MKATLEMALEALTNPSTIAVQHAVELIQAELAKPKQEFYPDWDMLKPYHDRIAELEDALAQPEQEPVAWIGFNDRGECREFVTKDMRKTNPNYPVDDMTPLYTAPPKREWVWLTDEDTANICMQGDLNDWHDEQVIDAVEAKLKEKNNGNNT